ncbi:MAG: type 4b pilus protein PilO2 [Alphaproteobacteria bacterium]|nr:type 4b pilus protein PilO2 [Alphaproteobacteria bacterium]MCL2889856.1 type 4b pilus protein PilO2 [Alphaproteobacteria bacterium]
MTQQVINIERKKYAVGLFWQPAGEGQNARAFAQKIAKFVPGRIKYFTPYRGLIGVGSAALGHRRRMAAAATEVMDSFADYSAFLAVFAVKQGFWLVAARNGIIIADKLYTDESAAKAEYEQLAELPDWGILVAPGYWVAPRAEEKRLEDIVTGDSRFIMQSVSKFWGSMTSILLLLLMFAGILYFMREPIIEMLRPGPNAAARAAAEAEFKAKQAALAAENKQAAASAVPAVIYPFDEIPDLGLRAEKCFDAITYLMRIIPGWNQVAAECDATTATAQLHRGRGILSDVYDFARDKMAGVGIIENSDADVTLILDLEPLPVSSRLAEDDTASVMRRINSIFQLMGMRADVRSGIETVSTPAGARSVNIVTVSAASKITPPEFARIFEDYDSATMPLVRWDARSRTWNYEVKIYVK